MAENNDTASCCALICDLGEKGQVISLVFT